MGWNRSGQITTCAGGVARLSSSQADPCRLATVGVQRGEPATAAVPVRKRFLLIALSALFYWGGTPLIAQFESVRFDVLDSENGLSNGTVTCLIQDTHGYLWFGTTYGLNRFDGLNFQVFLHHPDQPESLTDNNIRSLFLDRDGQIWVGTNGGGLLLFDPRRETFKAFLPDPNDEASLSHQKVYTIDQDREGGLLIGTAHGFNRLEYGHWLEEKPRFRRYQVDKSDVAGLSHNQVNCFLVTRSGQVWVGTKGGIDILNPDGQSFRHLRNDPADEQSLPDDEVYALYEDSEGSIWVGSWGGGGIARIPADQVGYQVPQVQRFPRVDDPSRYLSGVLVRHIMEDANGDLWLSQPHFGVSRLLKSERSSPTPHFLHYTLDASDQHSLPAAGVIAAQADRQNNIWLATDGGGVAKWDPRLGEFGLIHHRPGDAFGLRSSKVNVVLEDREGQIWVGTDAGLDLIKPWSSPFEPQPVTYVRTGTDIPDADHNPVIIDLLQDVQGRMWLATYQSLQRMTVRDGERVFVYYPVDRADPAALHSNAILCLAEDGRKNLWVGTYRGIHRLLPGSIEPGEAKFKSYPSRNEQEYGLQGSIVLTMLVDRQGRLWLATNAGLNLYRSERDDFESWRAHGPPGRRLPGEAVNALTELDGTLWLVMDGGLLATLDPESGAVETFKSNDPVFASRFVDISADHMGRLWLSSSSGLVAFDPKSQHALLFDRENGLPSNLLRGVDMGPSSSGYPLFVKSTSGLARFWPDRLQLTPQNPEVCLTQFRLANKVVSFGPGSLFDQPFPFAEDLTLNYTQNVFSIGFSSLHYSQHKKARYAYMMEGFNTDWIETDAIHPRAGFTNLSPGKYLFRVKASDPFGHWSSQERQLRLVVKPPPWRTWWAYTAYSLAFFALLFLFVHSQQRKVVREREINRKLRQVDKLKDEFLANTSHELRTPLNGIIGLAESLLEDPEGEFGAVTKRNLAMIASSGRRLASLVNDILDFSKMRNEGLVLRQAAVDLKPLADVLLTLCRPLVGRKEIQFINGIEADTPAVWADEDRLQQILFNLLGNAIKFTDSGWVRLEAEARDSWVEIRVMDTGIGIDPQQQKRIFDSFQQADGDVARKYGGTGLGLALARKLVELHGGRLSVESQPGQGSTFIICLPRATHGAEDGLAPGMQQSMLSHIRDTLPSEEVMLVPLPRLAPEQAHFHVLVVDDEPVNRQVVVNFLANQDLFIEEAQDGLEALQALQREDFDLILLDIMMPGMSGFEVCQKLRQQKTVGELPVIYLSAKNQVADLVAGFETGANDYLSKPFSKHELVSRVKTHLQLLDINRNLEQKVQERTANVQQLAEIGKDITASLDLDTLVERVFRPIRNMMDADEFGIGLFQPELGKISFQHYYYHKNRIGTFTVDTQNGNRLAVHCVLENKELIMGDIAEEFRRYVPELSGYGEKDLLNSMICLPLSFEGRVLGLMSVQSHRKQAYHEIHVNMLRTLASYAAVALANTHAFNTIEQKNRLIQDSLNYAKKIQQSLLPITETIDRAFPHNFIIYRPKEIVSGDFFWYYQRGDDHFLAVVDCTGHGVPGAFMSMIGHTLLNEIVVEQGQDDPGEILGALHEGVRDALKQHLGDSQSQDGMDLVLCRFRKEGHIQFAGANNPLFWWQAQQKELVRLKGDRHSIGGKQRKGAPVFQSQGLQVQSGDMLFLMTDGLADQPDLDGRRLGNDRLRALLAEYARQDAATCGRGLIHLLDRSLSPTQRDDITIIGVEIV